MLFNSFSFVILVTITAVIYYLPLCRNYQAFILVISSFCFYAVNHPMLLFLLLFSVLINAIASFCAFHSSRILARGIAVIGVVINLAMLMFFKYSPMIGATFFKGNSVGDFLETVPLPVGISFFTFQGITLVVDSFKTRGSDILPKITVTNPARHALNTGVYISFFAQLVAGPIVKAHNFIPQIRSKLLKDVDWNTFFSALVLGYFLKMVVADNLKDQTFWIAYPYYELKSPIMLLTLLGAYSVQIFADFAGYSSIAIGLGCLFGYKLPQNFRTPYSSKSFAEFWTRWHITLSEFLKEYVYIPLGGNRKGCIRTYANLLFVMCIGGLWHGAAWSYAVWGLYHGILLVVERILTRISFLNFRVWRCLRVGFVFSFVSLGWLLFKLPDIEHAFGYLRAILLNKTEFSVSVAFWAMLIYSLPVLIYHIWMALRHRVSPRWYSRMESVAFGVMLFLIVVNSGFPGAFVYFQF